MFDGKVALLAVSSGGLGGHGAGPFPAELLVIQIWGERKITPPGERQITTFPKRVSLVQQIEGCARGSFITSTASPTGRLNPDCSGCRLPQRNSARWAMCQAPVEKAIARDVARLLVVFPIIERPAFIGPLLGSVVAREAKCE